jgi:hypothetical protein
MSLTLLLSRSLLACLACRPRTFFDPADTLIVSVLIEGMFDWEGLGPASS